MRITLTCRRSRQESRPRILGEIKMSKYTINTECGLMKDIEAGSVEEAKDIYSASNPYDFDGAENGEYPGSWFFIEENGIRVEDLTAEMP